jgi:hypothetical protein
MSSVLHLALRMPPYENAVHSGQTSPWFLKAPI